jgi:uncharacterized protein (UPF0276 family)
MSDDRGFLDALAEAVTRRGAPVPEGVPAERVRRYAESLLDKRASELRRVIPGTVAAFPAVVPLYRGWLARNPAPAVEDVLAPGVREGLRALPVLAELADPEWVADLLRFEVYRAASRADGVERGFVSEWAVDGDPREERRVYRFGRDLSDGHRGAQGAHRGAQRGEAGRESVTVDGRFRAAVGYRHAWRERLLDPGFAGPDALEVVADHFFADPSALDALAERYPIVVHDTGCSVVTGGPTPERLARLREVVVRSRAVAFSDHLAMTRSPSGIDLGHLFPPLPTQGVLQVCVEAVHRLQDALGVPVLLENVSAPFRLPGAFSEAELFHALVDRTGCGLLVDVTNALLDARNDGVDPLETLRALPLHAARWAHLAGGRAESDVGPKSGGQGRPPHQYFWLDSHSAPVEDASFALLRAIREVAPLEGAIVERDSRLPAVDEVVAEARRAQEGWMEGGR